MNDTTRRLLGAALGGTLGVLAFWLLLARGLHVLGVVGGGLALGVSAAARTRRPLWGLWTALLALVASLLAQWWFLPFAADCSLSFFAAHVHELPRNALLSLAAVAVMGAWLGRGRARPAAG